MFTQFKKALYFPVASYFRFFAAIRLRRWNPKIIVVTGSNGKTTLLHLLESQIGEKAKYSHHANSSFGIPFNILDLHRKSLLKSEWIGLILKTPFAAFKKSPKEKLYVVEADCDRPGEGKFLSELLNPEIVLWVSISRTHSMNFDHLVFPTRHPRVNGDPEDVDSRLRGNDNNGMFTTVDSAIAYEFGYFVEYAKDLVILNGDSELMKNQVNRTKAELVSIKKENILEKYDVGKYGTHFQMDGKKYQFKFLLPEDVFYSIEMAKKTCESLNISFDHSFSSFEMPPGRGSIFQGIKNTTIVDSCYNANLSSMEAIISVFSKFSEKNKWVVLGDMLEQGNSEKEEHEKLAEIISEYDFEKIILMGPRVSKYTYPKLHEFGEFKNKAISFLGPKETLDYILENIKGDETILFKGARFMEGIIEHLLEDKNDIRKLGRREKIWEIRRKQWGL